MKKNEQYGQDPELIQRYSMRFMKVGAVFEEDGDDVDSWEGKSVEADGSLVGQSFSIGSV